MARRRPASADSPTETSAAAVLGDETVQPGDEPEPTFADSKSDPEPETPAEDTQEVVYESALPAETPATPTDTATPAVPKGDLGIALKHERARGKRLAEELAGERAAHAAADAEAKRLRDEQARTDNRKKLEDAQDLTEALPAIKDEITAELEPGIIAARRGVIRMSQKFARKEYADYDAVLEQSGVADAIAIDGGTGKPKDPVMWKKLILQSEDPGEDAYALGLSILDARGERITPKPTPGEVRAETPRPVIEVRPHADRFSGVRRLAPSTGRETRRVTASDIEQMADEEYARLPAHVREAYLAEGRV